MPVNPSEAEWEHAARLEFEPRRTMVTEQDGRAAEAERLWVLEIARHRCPRCGAPLVPFVFRGVEVDKCSRCSGVWLDRDHLDRMLANERESLAGLRRLVR